MLEKPIIYIHVGPYKTGTSIIQNNLLRNKFILRKNNFLYPESGLVYLAQHNISFYISNHKNYNKVLGGLSELYAELKSFKGNAIISSETFADIYEPEQLKKFKDTFHKEYDIKIVAYLRRQDILLESLWKQRLRYFSDFTDFNEWLSESLTTVRYLDYSFWLNLLSEVFGKDNIMPVLYKPNNPNHVEEFLTTLGIKDCSDFSYLDKRFASWSNLKSLLYYDIKDRSLFENQIVEDLITSFKEKYGIVRDISLLRESDFKMIYEKYNHGNEFVADTFFNSKDLFAMEYSNSNLPISTLDTFALQNLRSEICKVLENHS